MGEEYGMDYRRLIGALVDARKAAGLTQGDIAEACGVGQTAVSNWENFSNVVPADKLVTYAETVGTAIVVGARRAGLLKDLTTAAGAMPDDRLRDLIAVARALAGANLQAISIAKAVLGLGAVASTTGD